jgi:RHS repeat-associated protein
MSYGSTNSADDRLSRLAAVTAQGEAQPLGQFAWMGAGRLVSLTMPQPGIALSYKQAAGEPVGDSGDPYSGYDRFGRTVDMRWIKTSDSSSLSRIQYGYDRMSRRLWRQDLAAPATTKQDRFYGYDGLGQVVDSALGNLNINRTAIAGIPAQREAFDYDSIGNWKEYLRHSDGLTTLNQERTHNKDNQLIELNANASGLSYDATGNMTACRPDKDGDWSKGYTMVWDAWNRLVLVRNAQTSATVAGYAYDGLTRRITTTIGSTVRRFFYNDAWKCVEERVNASSNADRLYYWSCRTGHRDELLRRDRATSGGPINETLWCLMDYFDPIGVVNGTGVVQERYSFTAFGLASILTPTFTPRTASSFAWNFLFHGQFRDTESGWDNYGFRYYLPWLGSWPSRDPIGENGGVNLYGSGLNSLVNQFDLLGLWNCDDKCDLQAQCSIRKGGSVGDKAKKNQECLSWKQKNCKKYPKEKHPSGNACFREVNRLAELAKFARALGTTLGRVYLGTQLAGQSQVASEWSDSHGYGSDSRDLPITGFQRELVQYTQRGDVYQHLWGVSGLYLLEIDGSPIASSLLASQLEEDFRDAQGHAGHRADEGLTETRDNAAGIGAGAALDRYLRNGNGAALRDRLKKLLCS